MTVVINQLAEPQAPNVIRAQVVNKQSMIDMDGWMTCMDVLFNSISVITGQ